MVFREKGCLKCQGDIWLDLDDYGWYEQCTVCNYYCRFEGIKYVDDIECVVVSGQENIEVSPLRSTIEALTKMMSEKVREARVYVLTELSRGPVDKRRLRLLLRREGIFKSAFDAAVKELKEAGIIITLRASSKSHNSKLALAT